MNTRRYIDVLLSVHGLFSVSGSHVTFIKCIHAKPFVLIFLDYPRVKLPIKKVIENNIFRHMTYRLF